MDRQLELEEIKNRAIRGVVALTGRTMFLQAINSVTLIILLGILNASQIGIFFVVSAVIRIFNLFTDVGLGAALIQKKESLSEDDLKVAFTIQEILVLFAIIMGFVFTPQVQAWAKLNSDGLSLYYGLLIILFISSLKVIPSILLERTLAFEKQIIPQIVETLVFSGVVVFLALKGFGVRSYTWSFLISALVGLPIYYLISPWRVSLKYHHQTAKRLLSYGVAYQGKSFLAVLKDDLLTFFLGGFVGTTGVGYWGTAQKFAYFPYRFIVDSITKVTFPAYSRIQHDRQALQVSIEKSLFATSLILFPILTLFAVSAKELIIVFPRYKIWEPSLVSLYFLCAQAGLAALQNILVNVLDATGRVRTTLSLMVVWIVSTWFLTIFFVTKLGFTGIAVAAFAVSLTIVIVIILVKRVVNFRFLGSVWRQTLFSLVMGATILFLLNKLPVHLLTLVGLGLFGAIIYLGCMLLSARKELFDNLMVVVKAYRK